MMKRSVLVSEQLISSYRTLTTCRTLVTKQLNFNPVNSPQKSECSVSSQNVRLDLVNRSKRGYSSSSSRTWSEWSGGEEGDEDEGKRRRRRSTLYYLAAVGVLVGGGSYAAVPLYRIFCQSYSYGGTTGTHDNTKDLSKMKRSDKEITIRFNADRSSNLMWNFRPEQTEIVVTPGETALAFYRAENKTDNPIDGVSTYNVIPFEAGQYFNKVQCFCFEEQRLNPGETVELPVFFYIDPEFADDPKMETIELITLSYTFFESKEMPDWVKGSGVWGMGHGGGGKGVSSERVLSA